MTQPTDRTPPERLGQAMASEDVCPRCLGELDTGWECNQCGYDAKPHIDRKKEADHA